MERSTLGYIIYYVSYMLQCCILCYLYVLCYTSSAPPMRSMLGTGHAMAVQNNVDGVYYNTVFERLKKRHWTTSQ